jgi:hypothetical protein
MRALAHRFTRRQVIATSAAAGAPLVLAACGQASDPDDDRSEEEDPALLNAILEQHLGVEHFAITMDSVGGVVPTLRQARKDSISQLRGFITERDGEAASDPAEEPIAESAVEVLILQLEASIEASLASIGELSSPAYRQAVHRYITEDAAALAALRSETGDEVAPDSFVFGAPASTEDSE